MKENNRAEISLQELTDVDKEVKIKATREELEPQFQAAFKKYRSQIQMPGFRPGKVPLSIVKKRFGSEIEMEEINKFVQEVFEKEVVPEHDPVGGSEMTDLQWESDLLEVTFKIGVRPVFELADLSSVEVEKMVHDVTDDEVEEELRRILEKEGNFEDVDEMVTGEHRVVVDVVSLNEDGEPIEGESDTNQTLDLKDEGSADFLKALEGKSAGDTVEMELGEGEEKDRFRLTLKKVQKAHEAKLTDEFAQKQSNEEARNSDEFKSWLRSRIQNYYDQTSSDLFRQDVISSLVEAHDFSIPEVFAEQILNNYAEQLGQQAGGQLPPDFDMEGYKERMKDQAQSEGKWYFINLKLQEHFDDIEITPDDIDAYISGEAAKYGATVDQMKGYFAQNPSQLENLRTNIRENKVFEKLEDAVNIKELSKEEFRKKRDEEQK